MSDIVENRIDPCGDEPFPPGFGAVRLADFLDPPPPPLPPLRLAFENQVATVLRARNLPRLEAERIAYDNLVTERLNETFPDTDPSRCAHCGTAETPTNILLPIGAGERHAWLHSSCWAPWREGRRVKAIAELAAMKIEAP
jgi:hypothetical protein